MRMIIGMTGLLLLTINAEAQNKNIVYAKSVNLEPQRLWIGYQKTTSLIFNSAIRSVDRGSTDIMVQKADGVENVLKLKAARQRFEETNLSVITADGNIYPFDVGFSSNPSQLTLMVNTPVANPVKTATTGKAVFSESGTNETGLRKLAAQASITRRNINGIKDKAYGMELTLSGLYTSGNNFYYKLLIKNETHISYDIGSINFYVRDKKKVKRTATQEIALEPVMTIGANKPVASNSTNMLIVILPKQTIASDKMLVVEMEEDKGGRNLNCSIKNNVLLKAAPIHVTDAVNSIPNVLSADN